MVGEINIDGAEILSCAFNYDSNEIYLGTDRGKIRTFYTQTCFEKNDPFFIDEEFSQPITSI